MHSSLNKRIMRSLAVLVSIYSEYPSPVLVPPVISSHEALGLVTEECMKELSFYPGSLSGLKTSKEFYPLWDKNGSSLNDWDKGFLSQNTPHVTDALGTLGLSTFLCWMER